MISVIIPLYNERENIPTYDTELFPVLERIANDFGEQVEYVMVDDGSRDDTYALLQALAARRTDVIAITHGTNKGMGAALKTGFAASHGDLLMTLDSDLTFRPSDAGILLQGLASTGADLVSGSPYLGPGLLEEVSRSRLFLSQSVNFIYQVLLASKVSAVSPIFRVYRRKPLVSIDIESNNFEINAEILCKFIFRGYQIAEVPVPLYRRKHGVSKINIRREIKNHLILFSKIIRVKYLKKAW